MAGPETVATFASRAEADVARARLEAAGYEAAVMADDVGGMYPNLGGGGVRVVVAPEDADECRRILAEG